ncbi:MAG: class A beta-lactamase-related serine hydrolase [Bacteroidota bacterium]|nr:class A beta-lactamase-related serine hydrolase [Bacteroidota bacterium]
MLTEKLANITPPGLMNNSLKFILFILFFFTNLNFAEAQKQFPPEKSDKSLTDKLNSIINKFDGDAGVYVRNLKTGKTVNIAADSIFPTASMIKIPIMIGIFYAIQENKLDYEQELIYRDSLFYPGEDILGSFKDSASIHLDKVVMLMMTTSDNTASLWCQHLAGTGTVINKILNNYNFEHTRVNSRTPGRKDFQEKWGWGQTTPREMAELMVLIRSGKMLNKEASDRMYRNLTRTYWDEEAVSQIPATVQVASKQGAVNQSKSEVVLVNAPSGDYVFCIITKNQKDEKWEKDNEGYELIRKVSKVIWDHFEPKVK